MDLDILVKYISLSKESPVAKYLKVTASLSYGGIESLKFVLDFRILSLIRDNKWSKSSDTLQPLQIDVIYKELKYKGAIHKLRKDDFGNF